MSSRAERIAGKIPGIGRMIAKIDRLEKAIQERDAESLLLARENIGLRLKLKRMNGEKANVVFVCHRPAVWEALHGVYDALKADEHFHVTIVAIPNKKELPDTWLYHEEYESEGAEEFWKPYGCVNGYNYETKEWLDLRSLKPDYVFFQQPYNVARPPQYHSPIRSSASVSVFALRLYSAICSLASVVRFSVSSMSRISSTSTDVPGRLSQ